MKRSSSATTRSRAGGEARFSLFPFLAVLLCTMGALIVVLVVIARQARLQAEQLPVVAEHSQALKELETAREMARWRITELKGSRNKTEAQLADARLRLSGVEDHARQLREKLDQLKTAFAQLEASKDGHQQHAQQESELARLRSQVEDAKRRLAEAQQNAKKRTSYAVVPYEGPNGTHRRPIYLECRHDGVVLQPEGLVFGETDFNGPLGPGNPLDATLRAYREYLLERKQLASDGSNEHYPLLLVRPSGIEAYYQTQAAMKSWNSEFGYELIGDAWNLEFQPPDPVLASKVKQVVDIARVRQRRLAQAVPRHSENRSQPRYRAAPYQGGVVRDGIAEKTNGPGLQTQQPAKRFGNRVSSDAIVSQSDTPHPLDAPLTDNKPSQPFSPNASTPLPDQARTQQGHPLRGPLYSRTPESNQAAQHGGSPLRPGEWSPQSASDAETHSRNTEAEQVPCLAETRGENWGLRDASANSVPITRPIRIELYTDRLIIIPEHGTSQSRVISLGSRTVDAIDGTVSAVWDLMDSWGIAGKGMYWRPVLNVYVAPEADPRYHELATLLDGSGLEVQRK